MTDADKKRAYVSDLYSGPKWKKQIRGMHDDQITAIYLDHQRDGKKPQHDEMAIEIVEPERLVDIPQTHPHANEDLFEIY